MCSNIRSVVLLQTARGVVFRPDKPDIPLEVKIVYDCGSHQWSLTSAVKNAGIWRHLGSETLKITSMTSLPTTHYVPHHAVVLRDKETTRLRIVYDASAQSNGPSLNDSLYAESLIWAKHF